MSELANKLDELLERIARTKLGINSLEGSGRDRQDFHEVGVLALKSALREAFMAGCTVGFVLALENVREAAWNMN